MLAFLRGSGQIEKKNMEREGGHRWIMWWSVEMRGLGV